MRVLRGILPGLVLLISLSARSGDAERGDAERGDSEPPQAQNERNRIQRARQLITVLADGWNSKEAQLQRHALVDGKWTAVGGPDRVVMGRHGLAWGRGLLPQLPTAGSARAKREGDGRSPAGVFSLGTAFGQSAKLPASSHDYPYLPVTSSSYCVEDTRSEFYNQLIDSGQVASKGWQRWSPLLRPDGLFRWAVYVNHNSSEVSVGAGSCIFLHVWRGAHVGTAGCTAMPLEAIVEVVSWLDPKASPLLVQLPRANYQDLVGEYGWPELK